MDHNDAFPATLSELENEPLSLPLSYLGYKGKDKTTLDWIYHPGLTTDSPYHFIIIASPEMVELRSVPSRIIRRIDGSANVIPEADYQSQRLSHPP